MLINNSLELGTCPASWKIAKVTPLFKGGEETSCDNNRPISVLPAPSKVIEKVVNSQLQQYANRTGLISKDQYAYAKNTSTTTALIKVTDDWRKAIENGRKVVSTFIDLRKAFDVIDHSTLLSKLERAGFQYLELDWFKSYLSERQQSVAIKDVISDKMKLTHGVPQGSVLGPTLFNIHINGITTSCDNDGHPFTLYADDTEFHVSDTCLDIAENTMNTCFDKITVIQCRSKALL